MQQSKSLLPGTELSSVSCAATVKDNGADATGSFTDGTIFSATNNGASILVDVDDGVCIGQYYVGFHVYIYLSK